MKLTKFITRQIYHNIKEIKELFILGNISVKHFVMSIVLTSISVALHLCEICLLIPLLSGLIKRSFIFCENTLLGNFIENFLQIPLHNYSATFFTLLLTIFFIGVAGRLLMYYANTLTIIQIKITVTHIRQLTMQRYLSFGKMFFDKNSIGKLQGSLTYFSNVVTTRLRSLQSMYKELSRLAIYFLVLLIISWKLTLVFAVVFTFFSQWHKPFFEKKRLANEQNSDSQQQYNKYIHNLLTSIPLIKSYASEKQELNNFLQLSSEKALIEYHFRKQEVTLQPLQEINMLIALLVMATTMNLLAQSNDNLAAYFVFFYVVKMSIPRFNMMAKHKLNLQKIRGSLTNLLQILQQDKDKYIVCEGNIIFSGLKDKIELQNLTFSYEKKQILQDISFSICKNQMVAIVGHSGAGKTTIVSLLLRFYQCPKNSILIDNIDINHYTIESLMRNIAFVAQDPLIFNDTLKNNVCYGLENVCSQRLEEVICKTQLMDLVNSLPQGIESQVGERGAQLSGGEKQRIAIARALLKKAQIIILDEATSALDTQTESFIKNIFTEIRHDHTLFIVAHRFSTIENADKIIVLENGNIVEMGDFSQLINNQNAFHRYWKLQKT